jgi:hypothetical protein
VAVGVGNVPPVVYAPPPVYVAPQPVYVRPRPVYVAPPPAYYAPPVVYRPAPGYYYARGASTGAADGIAAITTTATGIDCRLRLRVFCSCPLLTPQRAHSALQMLAVARATAVLCALIGRVGTRSSGTPKTLSL